jgi:hypothetical protein
VKVKVGRGRERLTQILTTKPTHDADNDVRWVGHYTKWQTTAMAEQAAAGGQPHEGGRDHTGRNSVRTPVCEKGITRHQSHPYPCPPGP